MWMTILGHAPLALLGVGEQLGQPGDRRHELDAHADERRAAQEQQHPEVCREPGQKRGDRVQQNAEGQHPSPAQQVRQIAAQQTKSSTEQSRQEEQQSAPSLELGIEASVGQRPGHAQLGEGRYYLTERATEIPKIVTRETTIVSRNALVEGVIRPQLTGPSPLLADLQGQELPPVQGYVATGARPRASTVLTSDRGDPLLANWQFGLGRVVAWTSDARPDWAADWPDLSLADGAEPDARALLELAIAAEAAGLAVEGVSKSSGADASASRRSIGLASSTGFSGLYARTGYGVSASMIAGEGTVVWTRENDPSRPAIAPGMGVRFDRLADGSQSVLERILAEKAKQAPGRGANDAATKPPLFTDTPTKVAPAPVQEALGIGSRRPTAGVEPVRVDVRGTGRVLQDRATRGRLNLRLDHASAKLAARDAPDARRSR